MARVILETAGEDVTVGGSNVEVIGTSASGEVITITEGTVELDASFNRGGDTIVLAGAASSYTASVVNGRLVLTNGTTTINMPVGTAATTLRFEGGEERAVAIVDNELMIGDQAIEGSDGTPLEGGPGNTAALGAALETLQNAQEALDEYLAEADGDGDPTTSATIGDLEAELESAEVALGADIAADGTDTTLQNNLEDAQEAIADVQGLDAAATALSTAEADYEEAIAASAEADVELAAQAAAFDVRNTNVSGVATVPDWSLVENEGDPVVVSTQGELIVLGANGELELADPLPTGVTAAGLEDLLATAQAAYDAQQAEMDAAEDFDAAYTAVLELEGVVDVEAPGYEASDYYVVNADGEVDYAAPETNTPLLNARTEAEADLEEREDLYADIAEARAALEQAEDLQDAVDDARAAITDLEYAQPVLVDGVEAATTGSDVFLATNANGSITDFGDEGDDLLYIGEGFTAVSIADGANLEVDGAAGAAGDPTELEVLISQNGADTQIWIENTPFAGSDTTGEFDGEVITLVGVDADTVSLNEFGFITIDDPATSTASWSVTSEAFA